MCDQLDGRGCEVVDELEGTISDLEDENKDLKSEIETLHIDMIELINTIKSLKEGYQEIKDTLWKRNSLNVVMK